MKNKEEKPEKKREAKREVGEENETQRRENEGCGQQRRKVNNRGKFVKDHHKSGPSHYKGPNQAQRPNCSKPDPN